MDEKAESWFEMRWRIWLDAVERRPPVILWLLVSLPAVYGFLHEQVFSEELQKVIDVPGWAWIVYYVVLFAIHFEVGVIGRIKELEERLDQSLPKFVVETHRAWSQQHTVTNKTMVLLTTRIVNHGAPSTVLGYGVKCTKADGSGDLPCHVAVVFSDDEISITLPGSGGHKFSWDPATALPNQTEPIQTGSHLTGDVPILIDGHVAAAVRDGGIEITVTVKDFKGRESSGTFKGTGPAKEATLLVGEQRPTQAIQSKSNQRKGKKKRN